MSTIYRGTLLNDECRFYLTNATELIEEINQKTTYSPTAIAALGRSIMITSVLGIMQKDKAKITTIMDGQGPLGQIVVNADTVGNIKGRVGNSIADVPKISDTKLNVGGAVGTKGYLRVIKDLNLKDPFVSEIPIQNGEIGQDYAYYFSASEQVPTAISVGVLVDKDHSIKNAGLFLVQLMPGATEETITKLEKIFSKLKHISQELEKKTEEEFLNKYFSNDYQILEKINNQFKCDCSEEKFETAIKLLPPSDIIDIKKDTEIECICDFCYKKYDIPTKGL